MIHAYAIEPEVAVAWCDRTAFRFVCDKFGLGTPRMLLELPKFSKWKRAAFQAAATQDLSELDRTRLAEIFKLLGERRVRRDGSVYNGDISWLENAEAEYGRHPFAAIIAMANPRNHEAVISETDLGNPGDVRWNKPMATTPSRDARALAEAVSAMLENCSELHLVDPHFGPENRRHRVVLEKLLTAAMSGRDSTLRVILHCSNKSTLEFFQESTARMESRLPDGITLYFKRWNERDGGEKFHNRYILTDLGGVTFGIGLDAGEDTQTEDVNLMSAEQYRLRWEQFAGQDDRLDLIDEPAPISGRRSR